MFGDYQSFKPADPYSTIIATQNQIASVGLGLYNAAAATYSNAMFSARKCDGISISGSMGLCPMSGLQYYCSVRTAGNCPHYSITLKLSLEI